MKKNLPLSSVNFFSFLIFSFLSVFFVSSFSFAETSGTTKKEDVLEKYSCENVAENPYYKKYTQYYDESHDFSASFEKMKNEYHTDMNNAFNKGVSDLSKSVYSGDASEKACVPLQYDQKNNNSLLEFHTGMTEKFWGYECVLQEILKTDFQIDSSESFTFSEGISSLHTKESQILEEIEKSGMALRVSLQMYMEMRQWYPVHRDLECLISEMEQYRNSIRDFVHLVSIMPAKYYNYGSEKQQR